MAAHLSPDNDLAGHGGAPRPLYADAALLLFDKPAGLLSVPGRGEDKQDCLSLRVQSAYPDALIVHRLDMATSGLLLMARGPAMQRALSALFEKREVEKSYVAVVEGQLEAPAGEWQTLDLPIAADWPRRPLRIVDALNGKPSRTLWRVLNTDPLGQSTRVELKPVTGRTHQLRVHMQALGHPILGDALYAPDAVLARSPRLLLHACSLSLRHPVSAEMLAFESPSPF
jgi:tRNA pseudouridine32 synthase/23S rRNA pseudouridine746 synthase